MTKRERLTAMLIKEIIRIDHDTKRYRALAWSDNQGNKSVTVEPEDWQEITDDFCACPRICCYCGSLLDANHFCGNCNESGCALHFAACPTCGKQTPALTESVTPQET